MDGASDPGSIAEALAEQGNFRAALRQLRERDAHAGVLRIGAALGPVWLPRLHGPEAVALLEGALERAGRIEPALRAGALCALAGARFAAHRGVATAADLEDLAEARDVARDEGDLRMLFQVLSVLCVLHAEGGALGAADEAVEEALAVARRLGDDGRLGHALSNRAGLLMAQGQWAAARSCAEESALKLRESSDAGVRAGALLNLAVAHLHLGELPGAARHVAAAIADAETGQDMDSVSVGLLLCAAVASARGVGEPAARILGAACALRETLGLDFQSVERVLLERVREALEDGLGRETFARARGSGATLSHEAASRLALETLRSPDLG